jgi:hypothetical protein
MDAWFLCRSQEDIRRVVRVDGLRLGELIWSVKWLVWVCMSWGTKIFLLEPIFNEKISWSGCTLICPTRTLSYGSTPFIMSSQRRMPKDHYRYFDEIRIQIKKNHPPHHSHMSWLFLSDTRGPSIWWATHGLRRLYIPPRHIRFDITQNRRSSQSNFRPAWIITWLKLRHNISLTCNFSVPSLCESAHDRADSAFLRRFPMRILGEVWLVVAKSVQ